MQDLNEDVLLEIFKKCKFEDLIHLSETNYRFGRLIGQHILIPKYRFNDKIVEFYFGEVKDDKDISFHGDTIQINRRKPGYFAQNALTVLHNFGHLISSIRLSDQKISSEVNEYCSETLVNLRLSDYEVGGNVFQKFKKTFKKVSKLHIAYKDWDCGPKNRNLSEIFSSLRRLYLNTAIYSGSNCIDYYYPSLEHIRFPMFLKNYGRVWEKYATYPTYAYRYSADTTYEHIFDLNPQIRSIYVTDVGNYDVLRVANEKLNNLEIIDIEFLSYNNKLHDFSNHDTIHFKSVKEFCVELNAGEPGFIPFEFYVLEKLHLYGYYKHTMKNRWIEFVGKQKKLKILIINELLDSQQWEQLSSIIEKLTELEIMEIYWNRDDGYDEIARIIATSTKLKKIVFFEIKNRMCDELKRITNSQWQYEREESTFTILLEL